MTTREFREETKDNLGKSDQHFLKLQNLQYQAHHLKNEIDACLGFQSTHKALELKPVEDFFNCAPEDLKTEKVIRRDEHELTCARLKWEDKERVVLKLKLDNASQTKEAFEEKTQRKLSNLNNIRPQLQTVLQGKLSYLM